MTLLATERLFWHCGAPKLGLIGPIPPIPLNQILLFSVARVDGRTAFAAVRLFHAVSYGTVKVAHEVRLCIQPTPRRALNQPLG